MVLLLARRDLDGLYKAEAWLDISLTKALKIESEITTEAMKLDDSIIDCMVYSRREFSKEKIPSELLNVPFWYTPWWKDTAVVEVVK